MPLFVCSQCGCVDNTALAKGYWGAVDAQGNVFRDKRCTECKTGVWHNKFPKEKYDPNKHSVLKESEVRNAEGPD